jgi:hypothetical protein
MKIMICLVKDIPKNSKLPGVTTLIEHGLNRDMFWNYPNIALIPSIGKITMAERKKCHQKPVGNSLSSWM